jgi:hypothetical protein
MSNKYIAKMTGYKGTNADMTCTPNGGPKFQFELGKWYEHEGEIALCGAGFHFCVHPSGPYAFYSSSDSRVFKIEAEQVLDVPPEAGADFKLVAKRIRLVEEITPGDRTDKATGNLNTGDRNTGDQNTGNRNTGDQNTGDQNTGYQNTGNRNTGDRSTGNLNTGDRNTGDQNTGYQNTGSRNTGDQNTGDQNTGYQNTGNRNTGDWNTGNLNTGNRNTGNWNTGYWNTGDRNTGNLNTGDRNTGDWNATDHCPGFFCAVEPNVLSFDVQTELTHTEFLEAFPQASILGVALMSDEKINFEDFKMIPGITEEKLQLLHQKHLNGRKKA